MANFNIPQNFRGGFAGFIKSSLQSAVSLGVISELVELDSQGMYVYMGIR